MAESKTDNTQSPLAELEGYERNCSDALASIMEQLNGYALMFESLDPHYDEVCNETTDSLQKKLQEVKQCITTWDARMNESDDSKKAWELFINLSDPTLNTNKSSNPRRHVYTSKEKHLLAQYPKMLHETSKIKYYMCHISPKLMQQGSSSSLAEAYYTNLSNYRSDAENIIHKRNVFKSMADELTTQIDNMPNNDQKLECLEKINELAQDPQLNGLQNIEQIRLERKNAVAHFQTTHSMVGRLASFMQKSPPNTPPTTTSPTPLSPHQ